MKAYGLLGVCGIPIWLWSSAAAWPAERAHIDFVYVERIAKERAGKEFSADQAKVPEVLQKLSYDAYREIHFNPDKSLWREGGLKFRLEFFHPGYLYHKPVTLHEFTETHVQRIRFSTALFDYGTNADLAGKVPVSSAYAGFRLQYPLNRPDKYDEVAVFLGDSYFRMLGRGQRFGLSARGLALNAGLEHEEFPAFREFWIGKPKPEEDSVTIYALLDSPSVTGAYKFIIRPGEDTTADVTAELFFRRAVDQVGIAPLTSMYAFGENTFSPPPDFRPEVHDSDGLLIATQNGDRIWRPLCNEVRNRRSVFEIPALQGFGLLQRDRDFAHYEDIEAAYHLRPSAWVEPQGEWTGGSVQLVELLSATEAADNIVAFWRPVPSPSPGVPFSFAYRLHWQSERASPDGIVVATRVGISLGQEKVYEIVVDFVGDKLTALPATAPVKAVVDVSGGARLVRHTLRKNPFDQSWRLVLYLQPAAAGTTTELRASLRRRNEILTETWTYQWVK